MKISLLQIKEPCHKDWDQMSGDQRKRFCDHCQKHVHDISQMSQEKAMALISEAHACGQSVCIRAERDARGRVRFKHAASAAAAVMLLAGASSCQRQVMGMMVKPQHLEPRADEQPEILGKVIPVQNKKPSE